MAAVGVYNGRWRWRLRRESMEPERKMYDFEEELEALKILMGADFQDWHDTLRAQVREYPNASARYTEAIHAKYESYHVDGFLAATSMLHLTYQTV
jgi:hypothetical protein